MIGRAIAVSKLATALPEARLIGPGEAAVSGIGYDSRLIQPGDLFAALSGADVDGYAYIPAAERNGAAALLVERSAETALPQIVVRDSRASLAALAAAFYDQPSCAIGVIGITGTDGKTTTSYILDHILRAAGLRTGMIGTVAIRVGGSEDVHASRQTTPESSDVQQYLRQMADLHGDWAILETTSHGLAMHRVDHVRFRIGAVTNITHEHLDYHGSVGKYRRAKAMLLERVAADSGVVVINADDDGARSVAAYASGAKVIRFGVANSDINIRARDVRSDERGSTFVLDSEEFGEAEVRLPLIGAFNVSNALCAASIAVAAGVDFTDVARALNSAPGVPGRMSAIDEGQHFSVIVDYAHTPESLQKVLELLRGLHPDGRLIAVFGSAGERDVAKRPLQGAVSARKADITIVTSEDPRFEDADDIIAQIASGAATVGAEWERSLFARTDRREAIGLAFDLARPGDCVLLAGKGHEGSIIWGREKRPWDEATVARDLLHERAANQHLA